MLAFQFPPHHRRNALSAHSLYSALLTPARFSSSVCANAAIPRYASIDGSAAPTMRSGISGGRIGRSVACSRSARPGNCAGEPVRKTFCVEETPWSAPRKERRERGTHLNEMRPVCQGKRSDGGLQIFAEPGAVDVCHAWRELRLAHAPPFDARWIRARPGMQCRDLPFHRCLGH